MKKQLTSIAICMVLVLTSVLMQPITKVKADSTTNITVIEDARISSLDPGENFGDEFDVDAYYYTGASQPYWRKSWLKFSLSTLPSDIYITSAKMYLFSHWYPPRLLIL